MSKPTTWGNSGAKMQARNLNVPESKVKCEVFLLLFYTICSIKDAYLGDKLPISYLLNVVQN